ncbi:MAG TPA: hypothetical protein VF721_04285, partial [Pyrinomonadaceae bacterium]
KDGADEKLPKHILSVQHPATLKRTGFKFRIYDARHTFASRAVENGIDLLRRPAAFSDTEAFKMPEDFK